MVWLFVAYKITLDYILVYSTLYKSHVNHVHQVFWGLSTTPST